MLPLGKGVEEGLRTAVRVCMSSIIKILGKGGVDSTVSSRPAYPFHIGLAMKQPVASTYRSRPRVVTAL